MLLIIFEITGETNARVSFTIVSLNGANNKCEKCFKGGLGSSLLLISGQTSFMWLQKAPNCFQATEDIGAVLLQHPRAGRDHLLPIFLQVE